MRRQHSNTHTDACAAAENKSKEENATRVDEALCSQTCVDVRTEDPLKMVQPWTGDARLEDTPVIRRRSVS